MNEEIILLDKRPAQASRFLLCDTTGNVGELLFPEEEWVSSPIQCLDKAVDRPPGIVVVRFGKMSIQERETLVELSAALKRNSHTRMYSVLAMLHSKHRKLIEDLNRAKVDYVRYVGDEKLDSTRIREIIDGLGPDDRLERHLVPICPFLKYSAIDSQHEMAVCGAYLDRMVLGGLRVHNSCETEDHFHCEYYLKPRLKL